MTVTVESLQNYINAIGVNLKPEYSLTLTNLTYWNGEVVTGDNPVNSIRAAGINITIEIFKKNETGGNATLAGNMTLVTDIDGQINITTLNWKHNRFSKNKLYSVEIKYNYTELEDGSYTFKAYHRDDSYYMLVRRLVSLQ